MELNVLEEGFGFISHVMFVLLLGYYTMSALQWYSYKIQRVVLNYQRYDWHLFFFLFPLFLYYVGGVFFFGYLYFIFLPILFFWYKKLDKKLVFTARVKRFFLFLLLATLFQDLLCFVSQKCEVFGVILPLFMAVLVSELYEKILFQGFKKSAQKKLQENKEMIVIAITASYGKTSIKNYLFQILSHKYKCYMTPRSVNTLGGIIKDINDDLPEDTQIYIVEAGARLRGDINEIATFVNPHYAIVGQIGEQHLEYFKSLENIRDTKMELINSNRLVKAYVHNSANIKPNEKISSYGNELFNVKATLDGLYFDIEIDGKKESFFTPLLGEFNAVNLLVCIKVALTFMDLEEIKLSISKLKGVDHRLQKIEAGGKIIIDDSFNGNFEGMQSSYNLVSTYTGRKVIVTPGIVESNIETNEKLAKIIDSIFDLVIITGKGNKEILDKTIQKPQKIMLNDKNKLQEVLQEETFVKDLIIFSNDTPSFM
jgi:UDP-N-acetylmuramoyl-tripeptide--D-alanyl-D-alanine ligase